MPTLKKVFIISSVILLVVLVFLGIYNFAFKEKSSGTKESFQDKEVSKIVDTPSPEAQKIKEQGKIYQLTDEAVIAPTISQDGEHIVYYARSNGNVYEIALRGDNKKTISSANLAGLANILWSPDKNKVISTFEKDGRPVFYFYNFTAKTSKAIPERTYDITWTNLGDKIIYKYFDNKTKKKNISIADPDGSNWKQLAETSFDYVSIAPIPKTSLISFWNRPHGFEETSLQTVSIAGGEVKTVFSKKFGADYLWSPDGEKVLVSSSETKGSSKVMLATINKNGGEYQNLNIPTFVSKCVWSKDAKTVFYALPGSIPEGSVIPNDYKDKKFTTRDTFWKVDVTTGKKERLAELAEIKESFDAINLFLSPSENAFFFVNRIDGRLYGIDI